MDGFLASVQAAARAPKRDLAALDPVAARSQQTYRGGADTSYGPTGRGYTSLPPVGSWPTSVNDIVSQEDFNVNMRIKPFGRRYQPLGAAGFTAPGYAQIALIPKAKPASRNTWIETGAGAMLMPNDAIWAVNPVQWNYLLAQIQLQLARDTPERYLDLTPADIWFGAKAADGSNPFEGVLPDYMPWHIDGAVEFERGDTGGSTLYTEGYQSTRDGQLLSPPLDAGKDVTTSTCGQAKVVDYWEGQGVQENASLWMLLKKCDRHANPAPHTLTYTLAQKSIQLAVAEGAYTHTVTRATVEVNGADVPLLPYELHFLSVPDGGTVPPEYRRYVDERGYYRYDTLVLRLGRCLFAPPGLAYKDAPPPEKLQPMRDARKFMGRREFDVLLNPDDGLLSVMA
jgi:hypothetical protein